VNAASECHPSPFISYNRLVLSLVFHFLNRLSREASPCTELTQPG
jgi:hypothetical protein